MATGPRDLLTNPVWHALTGPQARFAQGGHGARRYVPEVAPFSAVPDAGWSSHWAALAELVGPGGVALVFRCEPAAPEGWELLAPIPCHQLVLPDDAELPAGPGPGPVVPLGTRDLAEMLDLVARTRPGPFQDRTVDLGTYLGVRAAHRLVGMAGERMRLPGATEISAVCTDPGARGRGIASSLVVELATRIRARGELPFLHVAHDNPGARRTYERLGFRVRRTIDVLVLVAPGGDGLQPRS